VFQFFIEEASDRGDKTRQRSTLARREATRQLGPGDFNLQSAHGSTKIGGTPSLVNRGTAHTSV
jgi:hypothetical protein